jgi:hypothetical protein
VLLLLRFKVQHLSEGIFLSAELFVFLIQFYALVHYLVALGVALLFGFRELALLVFLWPLSPQ